MIKHCTKNLYFFTLFFLQEQYSLEPTKIRAECGSTYLPSLTAKWRSTVGILGSENNPDNLQGCCHVVLYNTYRVMVVVHLIPFPSQTVASFQDPVVSQKRSFSMDNVSSHISSTAKLTKIPYYARDCKYCGNILTMHELSGN